MGITQGCNKIGYDLENEPKNLLKYKQLCTYLFSQSDPMGTNKQTDGQIFTQYSGISSHSHEGVWININQMIK
jgi:hypothetical protein